MTQASTLATSSQTTSKQTDPLPHRSTQLFQSGIHQLLQPATKYFSLYHPDYYKHTSHSKYFEY
ncbi:hypothetical protein FA95DRAFT_1558978 [Auriscalpium vulgare]|uniref:Uncharacterized protein n=1 Tax=Auriscalpium vulgare TaxID=40419 RepID=A0ACB8RU82_9AGAM|nr:hypothetical protein FA95DRAFT_1558978 [Auriscalpium vulgare]